MNRNRYVEAVKDMERNVCTLRLGHIYHRQTVQKDHIRAVDVPIAASHERVLLRRQSYSHETSVNMTTWTYRSRRLED